MEQVTRNIHIVTSIGAVALIILLSVTIWMGQKGYFVDTDNENILICGNIDSGFCGTGLRYGELSPTAQIGFEIFEGNCQQCHDVYQKVVGPALRNITQRRDSTWLLAFIKNPQALIDGGDPYAVQLYEEYKQYMPNHDYLNDTEIRAILTFIEEASTHGDHRNPDPAEEYRASLSLLKPSN
ncbi:MAG: cytochrome c [Bacteroidota bacterium]